MGRRRGGGEQCCHEGEDTVVSDWSETTWRAREHYTYPYHLPHAMRQMLGSRYWRSKEYGVLLRILAALYNDTVPALSLS